MKSTVFVHGFGNKAGDDIHGAQYDRRGQSRQQFKREHADEKDGDGEKKLKLRSEDSVCGDQEDGGRQDSCRYPFGKRTGQYVHTIFLGGKLADITAERLFFRDIRGCGNGHISRPKSRAALPYRISGSTSSRMPQRIQ